METPVRQDGGGGASEAARLAGKYLSFALGRERYAFPILNVQEIIGMMHITEVPGMPPFVKGVINLRGKVIPVLDLRAKLGMPAVPYDERTCIIVTDVTGRRDRAVQMGAVVDTVLEVLDLPAAGIERAPDYGTNLDTSFVLAMGRTGDGGLAILIDPEVALEPADGPRPDACGGRL